MFVFTVIDDGVEVGIRVGVGLADLNSPKKPPLFFWVGVGVKTDFEIEVEVVLLFKLILPVTTAKNTKTITKPKTNEPTNDDILTDFRNDLGHEILDGHGLVFDERLL